MNSTACAAGCGLAWVCSVEEGSCIAGLSVAANIQQSGGAYVCRLRCAHCVGRAASWAPATIFSE